MWAWAWAWADGGRQSSSIRLMRKKQQLRMLANGKSADAL